VRRALLPVLALALLLGGCGGDDSANQTPRPGVGPSLDADNLAMVHDELYTCLRKGLPDALLANYLAGQASISDVYGRSSFDERLAAPEAERALLDAGRAEFIGVRANRSLDGWRRAPEWDLLIMPASADAEQAAGAIADAGGRAEQDGVFVRVDKRAGSGDRARAAGTALTRCLDASRRG
jgi:hypothetical protein